MDYNEVLKIISKAVADFFNAKTSELPYDKTFTAKITSPDAQGVCQIIYNGKQHKAYSSISCNIGDFVRVCAPNNNWQELFIVENKTKGRTIRDIYTQTNALNAGVSEAKSQLPYNSIKNANGQRSIIVEGDANTYYPVHVKADTKDNSKSAVLGLGKLLGSKTPASWSGNHSNGTSSMSYEWMFRSSGWDGNCNFIRTLHGEDAYAPKLADIQLLTASAEGVVIWLRGGGCQYTMTCDRPIVWIHIHYQTTNIGTASYPHNVQPLTTKTGNGGFLNTVSFA